MNPQIEKLTQDKDVNGLVAMLWSSDVRDHTHALENIEEAARALEKIDDPRIIDPLIAFLERRNEFMEKVMSRYRELWQDRPYMSPDQAKDSALAKYQTIQFSAIRIFEKVGGERAATYLKRMAESDPDSDIQEEAGRALDSLQQK